MSDRKETPDILGNIMGSKRRAPAEPGPEEKPRRRGKRSSTSEERLARRGVYDLSAELKEAIAARATRLGIPASQLAHFLLLDAWARLESGEIDPEPYLVPSDSPKFRNTLDMDKAYPSGK